MLEDAALCLLEIFNAFLAFLDVFTDGKTEPVMIFNAFLHGTIELIDLLCEELLLNWPEFEESSVVCAKELI